MNALETAVGLNGSGQPHENVPEQNPVDSIREIDDRTAQAVLHRGKAGVTWKGVTVKLVGTSTSADCLEINGERPDMRRGASVTVKKGANAGTYRFSLTRDPDTLRRVIVDITRSAS